MDTTMAAQRSLARPTGLVVFGVRRRMLEGGVNDRALLRFSPVKHRLGV